MRRQHRHKTGMISFTVVDQDQDEYRVRLEPLTLSKGYAVSARLQRARQPTLGHGKVLELDDGTYQYEEFNSTSPEVAVAMGFEDIDLEGDRK